MKVLWITNILFSHHREMMGLNDTIAGGSWLYAAYEGSLNDSNIELHIITSADVDTVKKSCKDGNTFYILPGGGARFINVNSESNRQQIKALIDTIKPDIAVLWGTESHLAYLAVQALDGIPTAVYMQGVIKSIYDHYYDGMPTKYRNATIRDLIDSVNPHSTINEFKNQVGIERAILESADAVIVENDWCEDICKSINPKLKVFRNKLPIRDVFFQSKWSLEKMEPYSIFTNAGGYPIKGHHILLKALSIVKKQYPNFKCYIPGEQLSTFNSFKRRSGYTKMLEDVINEGDLHNNIVYTGFMSSEKMVEHLCKCNVYVMPSVMENHSSSLIEAMIVGAPCVSSLVGGVADLVVHGQNALLYNSTDAESLAGCIIRIFNDTELARKLGKSAESISITRKENFGDTMSVIYSDLLRKTITTH